MNDILLIIVLLGIYFLFVMNTIQLKRIAKKQKRHTVRLKDIDRETQQIKVRLTWGRKRDKEILKLLKRK